MKRPIEEHWLYRLTNTNAACILFGASVLVGAWFMMDARHRKLFVVGVGIIAVVTVFQTLRDILRRRRKEPIGGDNTERNVIRPTSIEIIPPYIESRTEPPRLRGL